MQKEDSKWTLMVNNKRKNVQRPIMEDLYIANFTDDTTEEEIVALLGLGSTTYLCESSLARRQYTDNGRFAGCIHVRIPQKSIETVLELNGLSFKNRDLVIQPLTEMKKLQLSKRNNYTPYRGLSFWTKQCGEERGNGYFRERGQASTRQKISSSNQDQMDKSLLGKEIIRLPLPIPWKAPLESRYGFAIWKHHQRQKP